MVTDQLHPDLSQRLTRAASLRKQGYNCAQTLLICFDDYTGFSEDETARIAIGLGGGCGGTGGTCGVITGMAIVLGRLSEGSPSDKAGVYVAVRSLSNDFVGLYGHTLCKELKRPGAAVPCSQLIEGGITLLHKYLERRHK